MYPNSEILFIVKSIMKLYGLLSEDVCEKFALTRFEMDVLAFLSNNPHRDTASDIIEFRMLPKSNVSQAVEQLIQKKLLTRTTDKQDRRRVHLSLTSNAKPIVNDIQKMQHKFNAELFEGFSDEELAIYTQMNGCIVKNVFKCLGEKVNDYVQR